MTMTRTILAVAMLFTAVPGAFAQNGGEVGRQEVKQSMKARYPRLMELKRDGTVGETTTGMVGAGAGGGRKRRSRAALRTDCRGDKHHS